MSLSADQARLLGTDRWRWLADVVDHWYEASLSAEDGATQAELDEAATAIRPRPSRAGQAWRGELPDVLAEWFLLVGHRLHDVQDIPATLPQLWGDADGIEVWWENQGCWTLSVGADGTCFLDDDECGFPRVPLPSALRAMVISDTLVGAWSVTQGERWLGPPAGPLGRLAAGVRGGVIEDDVPTEALTAAYGNLPVLPNPSWHVPPRGDAGTVIRGLDEGSWALEWMVASDAAYTRFTQMVDLDPPGGECEVLLAFAGLDATSLALVCKPGLVPDVDRFARAVKGLGHLGVAAGAADGARFYVTTVSPDAVVSALRAAIPRRLTARAVIAVRPLRLARFRVVVGSPSVQA